MSTFNEKEKKRNNRSGKYNFFQRLFKWLSYFISFLNDETQIDVGNSVRQKKVVKTTVCINYKNIQRLKDYIESYMTCVKHLIIGFLK